MNCKELKGDLRKPFAVWDRRLSDLVWELTRESWIQIGFGAPRVTSPPTGHSHRETQCEKRVEWRGQRWQVPSDLFSLAFRTERTLDRIQIQKVGRKGSRGLDFRAIEVRTFSLSFSPSPFHSPFAPRWKKKVFDLPNSKIASERQKFFFRATNSIFGPFPPLLVCATFQHCSRTRIYNRSRTGYCIPCTMSE